MGTKSLLPVVRAVLLGRSLFWILFVGALLLFLKLAFRQRFGELLRDFDILRHFRVRLRHLGGDKIGVVQTLDLRCFASLLCCRC